MSETLMSEMQNQCAELKIRAERRGGELLAGMERHGQNSKLETWPEVAR